MRQTTNNGINIKYADEIGFAFMPCVVKASGSGVQSLEVVISCGAKSYTYALDAFDGQCIMDYREYVQACFDGIAFGNIDYSKDWQRDGLGADFGISVSVKGKDNAILATLDFSTFYVWGAMKVGETWNGFKRLTWFTNFPFSFGLYLSKVDTNLLVGYEGAPNKLMKADVSGIVDFSAKILPADARYSIIYDYDGEIKQATFDNFFDLTFYLNTGGKQSKLLRIDYDNTKSGIYLRWIDRHGFIRYWLFSQGEESREVSSDGEFIRNNLLAWSDLYGYVGANGRRQGYSREDTITICAPNVDRETFDLLQDLTTSPVVDMYLGGDWRNAEDIWQSVTIKAGSYTKTTACLQDFVANVVVNDINIQKL